MAERTCARCGKQTPEMPRPPLSGDRGRSIQQRTCATCWTEWLQESANLINHYGLQVAVPADREQLYVVMAEFLKLPEVAPAVPIGTAALANPTVDAEPPDVRQKDVTQQ